MTAETWMPSEERMAASALAGYRGWLGSRGLQAGGGYQQLWQWSVDDIEAFWPTVWDFFEVLPPRRGSGPVLTGDTMPDVHWFEGETVNWAENALRHPADSTAIIARDEHGADRRMTYGELREQVASAAAGLRFLGVTRGDRVAAILPNREEAVVAVLACASIGAVWALCSPEFGPGSIVSRLAQIEPVLLIAADAYEYQGRVFDQGEKLAEARSQLPTLRSVVTVRSGLVEPREGDSDWAGLLAANTSAELHFEPVPFEHPLWILYSSGTTGLPKAMLQGHGGITLELLKNLGLHLDIRAEDRLFWYTTTGWVMWNLLVSGLLLGAAIVTYDGPPNPAILWPMCDEVDIDIFGANPGIYLASREYGRIQPPGKRLRTLGSTGSPLPASTHRWMAEAFGPGVQICSVSGGTDMCSCIVGANPMLPVTVGQIQGKLLGIASEAFDENGVAVVDTIGELVITKPIPSMPLGFCGDADGSRMRESYYSVYPGIWRQGDWISFTETGASVIYGRSDATLNRGGVRMGSSEFYRVLESVDEIADALVVDSADQLVLFVVLKDGADLDDDLAGRVRSVVRGELSPRHVPDRILQVGDIPYTLTGKKCEVPVKRMLQGVAQAEAVDIQSLRNPASLAPLLAAARLSRS